MFLIIDNSEENKVVFLSLNKKFVQRIFKFGRNVNLSVCLEKFLASLKMSLKDIRGIGVVVGAGKFTATRLAVTFANTLAWALKIPVIGLPANWRDQSVDVLSKKIRQTKVGKYVMASYSGEARIGLTVQTHP